jgi:glycosyltransferase involved in cell wall biosynthesis
MVAAEADVVHIQHTFDLFGYMGLLSFPVYQQLARLSVPVVTTLHELPRRELGSLKARIAYPYLRECIRWIVTRSTATIVHSQVSFDTLAELGINQRIHVIPHGSIAHAFEKRGRAAYSNPPTIGFFGFISKQKGVHRLLEAIAELPQVRLIIAGAPRTSSDQDYEKYLHSRAAELRINDRVEFRGFVPDNELATFFDSIDLAVFPYEHSTASGALHIALAHECVILASNLPVFDELHMRYDCLDTFDLAKPETLVAQVKQLLTDQQRRAELQAGCYRSIASTNWSSIGQQTYALYQSLL